LRGGGVTGGGSSRVGGPDGGGCLGKSGGGGGRRGGGALKRDVGPGRGLKGVRDARGYARYAGVLSTNDRDGNVGGGLESER